SPMKPCSFRMQAIPRFRCEAGTSTCSCRATEALRMRVSMSAMGSDNCTLSPHQLDLTTPGNWPFSASCRKQMRHSPNLRMKARGRPQMWQRFRCCTLYFGGRWLLTIFDTLAILPSTTPVRHAHELQHPAGLFVGVRVRHDRHLHAADAIALVVLDLGKHKLLPEPDGVAAPSVEGLGRYPAEVPHARQRDVHELVQEGVGAIAAQRHHDPDGHALAQLER